MLTITVTQRITHHAGRSGYDRLVPALAEQLAPLRQLTTGTPESVGRVDRLFFRLLSRGAPEWYEPSATAAERAVLASLLKGSVTTHLLWGEDTYHASSRLRAIWERRGSRLLATFHQPPSYYSQWDERALRKRLASLDGVVTVASNQRAYFAALLGDEMVFNVPHGVDTSFFRPVDEVESESRKATCLFVGQWMRDIETLRVVVGRMRRDGLVGEVRGVTSEAVAARVPEMTRLPRLSDEELRAEYQAADLTLMPLHDCTANCAVLESLACGTPVVASDVGGIRDYVTDDCGVLVPPSDADAMTEAIRSVLADPQRRSALSSGARSQALRFDWDPVASAMIDVYGQVARR